MTRASDLGPRVGARRKRPHTRPKRRLMGLVALSRVPMTPLLRCPTVVCTHAGAMATRARTCSAVLSQGLDAPKPLIEAKPEPLSGPVLAVSRRYAAPLPSLRKLGRSA